MENMKSSTRRYLRICFWLYMVVLFYFVFFSERYGRTISSSEYRYNLEFFKEIRRFIHYRNVVGMESFVVNILGNIFAFTPLGFFLPMISKNKRGIVNVTLLCFEVSMFIELVQLIYKIGAYDVDDLVMNTLGGLLGYLIYLIVYKINKRRIEKYAIPKKER